MNPLTRSVGDEKPKDFNFEDDDEDSQDSLEFGVDDCDEKTEVPMMNKSNKKMQVKDPNYGYGESKDDFNMPRQRK